MLGKILHNLLMNVEYDLKDILTWVLTENMSRVHDWALFFEKNEYLKR